jgi:hypothetical protein
MSQENVEIVRRAHPGPDIDIAALVRDDELNRDDVRRDRPAVRPGIRVRAPFSGRRTGHL